MGNPKKRVLEFDIRKLQTEGRLLEDSNREYFQALHKEPDRGRDWRKVRANVGWV